MFSPSVRRLFPESSLDRIAAQVGAGEMRHSGQVVFAVEADMPLWQVWRGVQAPARAREVFARLGVWDTEANNGVLIYLLLADHRIEIVADRGLRDRVDSARWRQVCALIEEGMRAGQAEQAVLEGGRAVSDVLSEHFPRMEAEPGIDELSNHPRVLRK
jgi:uncharacterized membrane protein